jgi:formiminotetrahydrofolate cyclodeaminase
MLQKRAYGRKRIDEFLEILGKEVPPLPAGGCAAALTGAMCAALEQFVAQLSIKKRKNPDPHVDLNEILFRLKDLQKKCVEMMDRDVREYEQVMLALRMPKTTREEQATREDALQKAKAAALGPPMDLVECGLEMLRHSLLLIEEGYIVALADAGVAAEMAHACLWGALWIARANLQWIDDGRGLVEPQTKFLDRLETEGEGVYRKITEELKRGLSRPNQP